MLAVFIRATLLLIIRLNMFLMDSNLVIIMFAVFLMDALLLIISSLFHCHSIDNN